MFRKIFKLLANGVKVRLRGAEKTAPVTAERAPERAGLNPERFPWDPARFAESLRKGTSAQILNVENPDA